MASPTNSIPKAEASDSVATTASTSNVGPEQATPSTGPSDIQPQPAEAQSPEASLAQILPLLQSKQSTPRFVGLSLLRSLLDTHAELRSNPEVVTRCWNAIPEKFLSRLLKASKNASKDGGDSGKPVDEKKDLTSLGVSVVRVFAGLLPVEVLDSEKVAGLVADLLALVLGEGDQVEVRADTKREAWEALVLITRTKNGAKAVLAQNDEVLEELVKSAMAVDVGAEGKEGLGLDVAKGVIAATTIDRDAMEIVQEAGNSEEKRVKLFEEVVRGFTSGKGKAVQRGVVVKRLEAVAEMVKCFTADSLSTTAINNLVQFVKDYFTSFPSSATCRPGVQIFHALIQRAHPAYFDPFFPKPSDPAPADPSKPFTYTFITLVIVEIRATIPSLMEKLASDEYGELSLLLAAYYDVLGYFIFCLLKIFESDAEDEEMEEQEGSAEGQSAPRSRNDIPPDLLLRLRKDISEAMSLTIEYLRDRWDAAITGVRGLDPSARNLASTATSKSVPALTWEHPTISLLGDPVILAGSRVLSMWLREDENAKLREEASGIMDVLLDMYKAGDEGKRISLMALEGITREERGIQAFLETAGFINALFDELIAWVKALGTTTRSEITTKQFISVLLPVVESPLVPQSRKDWLGLLEAMLGALTNADSLRDEERENFIAAGQLLVVLMMKAPTNVRKNKAPECEQLVSAFLRLKENSQRIGDREGAEEVAEGLATVIRGRLFD